MILGECKTGDQVYCGSGKLMTVIDIRTCTLSDGLFLRTAEPNYTVYPKTPKSTIMARRIQERYYQLSNLQNIEMWRWDRWLTKMFTGLMEGTATLEDIDSVVEKRIKLQREIENFERNLHQYMKTPKMPSSQR